MSTRPSGPPLSPSGPPSRTTRRPPRPTSGTRARGLVALLLAALLMTLTACGGGGHKAAAGAASPSVPATASASVTAPATGAAADSSTSPVKLAKTKFVLNSSLAAGATYQWIYKPYKAGTFKKGAKGRTFALVKAGLAGGFTYNRLKAALHDAQGDKTLAKLVAPLTKSVDSLKALPAKLKKGESPDSTVNSFQDTINNVKSTAKKDGDNVTDKVPSLSQLKSGS
ncbi:hypothetical protein [Streptantibioticus parmotrematis]